MLPTAEAHPVTALAVGLRCPLGSLQRTWRTMKLRIEKAVERHVGRAWAGKQKPNQLLRVSIHHSRSSTTCLRLLSRVCPQEQ